MPVPQSNGKGADQRHADIGIAALIADAEALHDLLHDAAGRTARLVAPLKQQRRQARALEAAIQELRKLQLPC